MPYDPEIHHRRSIRLKEFDYSQPGAYFMSTNTIGRKPVFGKINNIEMLMNDFGMIVEKVWSGLPRHYPQIEIDDYCVMPDHFHGIIKINEIQNGKPTSLSEFIRAFKSFSSREINLSMNSQGTPIWQRNYFEHVIRTEKDMSRIRQYILDNPIRWSDGRGDIEPSDFFR
jgi:putative transposase